MCVQPNRSDSHIEQTRSCRALEEWWTYQQSPEAQTALTQNCWQEWFHLKLPLIPSFLINHVICILFVEDHTLVCFSSCWPSVKLLLTLRDQSTGLKQVERNRDLAVRSATKKYWKIPPTTYLHRSLRQRENDLELKFSISKHFLNSFLTRTK